MSEAQSRVSPIVAIAAVSVVIFSVVGVGVMTGLIPSSRSTESTVQTSAPVAASVGSPAPAAETPRASAPAAQPHKGAERKSGQSAAAPNNTQRKTAPDQVASSEPAAPPVVAPAPTPAVASAPTPVVLPAPAPQICAECGVIDAINVVEQKGQGSGLGAVGGAVVGGLVGNQIGSGRGNTVATVAGAVGGALAGNEIEKRVKSTKQYNVSVRMDDGNFRSFTFDSQPAFNVGEKVKVVDGKLVRG